MALHSHTPKPQPALLQSIERPTREKSEGRQEHMLWLDKNENMDPIYIASIKKIAQDIPDEAVFGYPDCYRLYKKLSSFLHVPINELMLAAGSDGVIRAVYEAFVSRGDTVIYTEPTFAMYALYAQMYGALSHKLHYIPSHNGPLLSCESIIQAIESVHPKLVCIPNPNSPSGTIFHPDALRDIIKAAGAHDAVILIDEAYHPFYQDSALTWIHEFPHLIVARTFSKAWGAAGIRLGYGIGCRTIINELQKIRPMYEAGAISITLAERLLDKESDMLASVQRLNQGKEYFLQEMRALGFRTLASEGNFLHVAFADAAFNIHAALADKVLYRRDFAHPSLAGFSRFTATTATVFKPVVEVIRSVMHDKPRN